MTRLLESRPLWIWGGSLLIAAPLIQFTLPPAVAGRALVSAVCMALGVVLAALGGRRNLVNGRRGGTIALLLFATWTLIRGFASASWMPVESAQFAATIAPIVTFAVTLVVAVDLGRDRHLPDPWRWAPMWSLAAQVATWTATTVFFMGPGANSVIAPLVNGLGNLVDAASAVFLGVLLIVLALQPPTDPKPGSGAQYDPWRNDRSANGS